MRKVEHRLRLDLLRGGNQGYIRVKRGENGARRLAIALYMHSVPYMADAGTTAVFRAIKPDNTKLFNSATITDNVVTVGLTTQTVAALGTVRCELSIYGTNNELLYSPQFDIIVEDYLYSDTAVESTSEYTELTEAISNVNNIVSTEAARVAAENQRVANENARVSAEAERETAETARAAAETARASAETERASAETTRASAESSRVSNENIRKQAEKQRVSSETQRNTAETARSTAESGRRSAETARVQEFNAIKADAQDAATAEAARALAEELRMALYNQWDNATASVKGGANIDVNVVEADGHKNFDFTIPSDSLYCETRTTITNGDLETIAREHARTIIVFDLSPIDFNNENPTDYGLPADIAWNFTLINGPSQNVGTKDYFISYPNATVAALAFVFVCPQTLIDGNNIYMRRLSYWDEKDKDEVSHWKFEGENWEPVGGTADAVTYTPQTLTEEQKSQARTNIGAEKAGTAYTKPASGIPKSDLADAVQTSLNKADAAISLGLTAATPGQIIKVKTVQDGKPTEWEAVDMPSGGELILEYVHDESKFPPGRPAVYPIAYDADTKIWTSDGRLDLTTIAAAGETVSKPYQINIIEPLLQLSQDFDHKKWNPVSTFKLKVLSSNTFSTSDYVPPVIADDWSKYIMIANETVSINMPSNASDKIRMVFDGQFTGATRYAMFGMTEWLDPNSRTTIANEIGYQQRRGIYNHIVCDFDLENGKIYGTTSQTFVSYDKIGSAQGVYYPTDAVAWPQIVLTKYAYAVGYNAMPYKGRLRIYNRG